MHRSMKNIEQNIQQIWRDPFCRLSHNIDLIDINSSVLIPICACMILINIIKFASAQIRQKYQMLIKYNHVMSKIFLNNMFI